MQRHHLQMIIVFAATLTGVIGFGTLAGLGIGLAAASALAPWSNLRLRNRLAQLLRDCSSDDGKETKVQSLPSTEERVNAVKQAIRHAMQVEGMAVTANLGNRDLQDQDIQLLIETERLAHHLDLEFELLDDGQRRHEANIDLALRRRRKRPFFLRTQY
jgi:hypothetical protein